jgi:hypothetical protein
VKLETKAEVFEAKLSQTGPKQQFKKRLLLKSTFLVCIEIVKPKKWLTLLWLLLFLWKTPPTKSI